ncbi:hypothetical protein JHK87_001338 [Glycine soja]|nr:hypothetical protein JHK87_001338 [Glycine soja]
MKLRASLISHLEERRKAEASSNYKSQLLANIRFARYGRKLGHKMIRVFSASWIELNIATRVFHDMNGSMAQAL